MEAKTFQIALWAPGDRSKRAVTERARIAARLGAFDQISSIAVLHKDQAKIAQARKDLERCVSIQRAWSKGRRVKGPGFTPVLKTLSGPGTEFVKSLDVAYRMLPEYEGDIEAAAEEFSGAVENSGGVSIGWHMGSAGGHLLAGELFTESVQKRISRPECVVLDLLEPEPADEAAHWLFQQRVKFLLEHNWQGYDVTFLVRSHLALTHFGSGQEFDDIANVGLILWLAAKGPTQVNLGELLATLKQKGPLAGMWGVKIPVPELREARLMILGRGIGNRRIPTPDSLIRHQCLTALNRVSEDPSTSLTGLPPLGGSAFFGLAVPSISPQLADDLRRGWLSLGPLTIVQSPMLKAVYAVRISPVDWTPLAREVGASTDKGLLQDGWRPRRFQSFSYAATAVEGRLQMGAGRLGSIWSRDGGGK